jgi:superfamily II DNA helicase RecQ
VVSPLVSLMADQTRSLKKLELGVFNTSDTTAKGNVVDTILFMVKTDKFLNLKYVFKLK